MRKILLISFMLASWQFTYAGIVKGKVLSSDTSEELIGVTVMVKGTNTGTITDVNGDYSLNVPEDNSVLVFSYIGYKLQEITVEGRKIINVQLAPDVEELEGVVVTALGIKRSEKALGYAVQKVDGELVSDVKEPDVMNALAGKVSGVSVIQADGAIGGGGSRVVIRGESSLAGNNDPLYIINGVQGDANDIAPDDIESMSVLKGPAAAALYGSKAGGGVIIITSKSGNKKDGVEISINSSTMFQTTLVLPEYQNKYGMGYSGVYSYNDGTGGAGTENNDDVDYNWGPEFDGELRSQFTGNDPWVAYPDNVKDFYNIGHTLTNNVSLTNTTESGSFRFSYTNTDQSGIMPNNGMNKSVFAFNSVYKPVKGLTITPNMSYINTVCDNSRTVDVKFIHRNIDFDALKDYWVPGMEDEQQMNYRQSGNNPYFVLYESPYSYKNSKVIANVAANYEFLDHWSVMGRVGIDFTNNEFDDRHAKSTYTSDKKEEDGYYATGYSNTWNKSADFLAAYNKTFFEGLNVKLSFGGSHYRVEYKTLSAETYDLKYAGIYNLNNRTGYLEDLVDYKSNKEENSLYAFLNLDYKGKVFLDLTGREDWSSTLISTNNNFTYPSATLSAIISDIFQLPGFISFLKVRASVAGVGNSIPDPYFTIENRYEYETNNGLATLSPLSVTTDPYLEPEKITGYEVGLDLRMLQNRLNIDASAYYSVATNQIINNEKTVASGGDGSENVNAGRVDSKGIEITLNAKPVKTNDFTWDLTLNWSIDRSYIKELDPDNPDLQSTQAVNSHLSIVNQKGQRMGTFLGFAWQRDPDGNRLYTSTGDTQINSTSSVLGNYNPDWMAGMNNTFTYKNVALSCLFDLRWGGLIYNETERKLNFYGFSEATLLNDRDNIVPDGVVDNGDGTYTKLALADEDKLSGSQYWESEMNEEVPECVLFDDTYMKLRELRISYSLPKSMLNETFIKSVSISAVGRNLAVWSKVKHVDPETYGVGSDTNVFGGTAKIPGYVNSSVPSVRSYGFSLSCKF